MTITTDTRTTIVPAKQLAFALTAVLPHRDTKTVPQLGTVHLTVLDGVATLEATDRYTIGEASFAWDGPDVDIMLPPATADALLKLAKTEAKRRVQSGTAYVAITVDGLELTFDTPDARMTLPACDADTVGAFPRTAALWPDDTAGLNGDAIGMTPRHFAKLDRATVHPSNAFRFAFNGTAKPIVATPATDWAPDGVTFRALIMPVRLP